MSVPSLMIASGAADRLDYTLGKLSVTFPLPAVALAHDDQPGTYVGILSFGIQEAPV